MHVREGEAWHGVCERVRVKGVRHIGVVTLHTVHAVEHATHQEAVAVVIATKTCAKAAYREQVAGAEVGEQDDFLVKPLCVHSWVE